MCTTPLTAYRSKKWTEEGKRPLVFNKSEGYLDQRLQIGCGQCIECRMEKARNWAIRCTNEAQYQEEQGNKNCFLTLTYNDDNLPHVKSLTNEKVYHETLYKSDLQNFFKRLRKDGNKFRYFAAGEYGGIYGRPHYHVLLFGFSPPDPAICDVSGTGFNVYSSDYLDSKWTHGNTYVQEMCFETAFYTAGYALKKLVGSGEYFQEKYGVADATEYYDGITPEFHLTSRRPGLGYNWFIKYRKDIYPGDKMRVNNLSVLPPRYYYDKEVQFENAENPNRKEYLKNRLSELDIQRKKRAKSMKMAKVSDEIKYLQTGQKRSRAINQLIKARRYEQGKFNSGKSVHDIRQKNRRVLPTPNA